MQCLLPRWRQVLIFQSPRQLLSHGAGTLGAATAGLLAFDGLLRLFGYGPLHADVIVGTLIGSLAGSLRAPYEVLPFQWRLITATPAIAAAKAAGVLAGIKYHPAERGGGRTLYRLAVPWYLAWLEWRESAVEVRVDGSDITITGARIAVRRLHQALQDIDIAREGEPAI
ncbi:hypothetical protein AZA_88805 [Nitrospirillum viridazoti Y2]|uniref:Uncharacterized protein n=1 Tax=Nitrospirillum amazonense TaxID=28077 RepID=A0A560HJB0_9PROT|nr:hypothetical protein [Nitrospirillum amazonense]EGY01289.1 hypothetical protein AZA_88805 [Nitrospirillum amazonense Y2]TWB46578.1 hypothetical protein FBZ92_14724 [Nitrospirillum amazonense]